MTDIDMLLTEPGAYINKIISYKRRLRVRATRYTNGAITFALYHHDQHNQILWEHPITMQQAATLDWSINVFGYKGNDRDGWAWFDSDRDNTEDLTPWLEAHGLTHLLTTGD